MCNGKEHLAPHLRQQGSFGYTCLGQKELEVGGGEIQMQEKAKLAGLPPLNINVMCMKENSLPRAVNLLQVLVSGGKQAHPKQDRPSLSTFCTLSDAETSFSPLPPPTTLGISHLWGLPFLWTWTEHWTRDLLSKMQGYYLLLLNQAYSLKAVQ